jgi:hypothetical protein
MVRKLALWALAIAAPLAVFSLYTRPPFLVMLADQLWACF